jgi:hypothetical protein
MPAKQDKPIISKEDIPGHPDNKIDEDFKRYPSGPAKDQTIKPKNKQEEKTADLDNKDGEKKIIHPDERKGLDEQGSDGSANAFEEK